MAHTRTPRFSIRLFGLVVVVVTLFSSPIFFLDGIAQPATLSFESISTQEGLTNLLVTAIKRDASGFIWIGTHDGLNRFDGMGVKSFGQEQGLRGEVVTAIAEFPRGSSILWAGTQDAGLFRYDVVKESFSGVSLDSGGSQSEHITALLADSMSNLWIATNRLYRYRSETQNFDEVSSVTSDTLFTGTISALVRPASSPGEMWVGTSSGLFILSFTEGSLGDLVARSELLVHEGLHDIATCEEVDSYIWCGTENGDLLQIDVATKNIRSFTEFSSTGVLEPITSLRRSNLFEEVLWVGTRGNGLVALHATTLEVQQYTRTSALSLNRADVLSVEEDSNGQIIWVGTTSGLNKAGLRPKPFSSVVFDSLSTEGLRSPATYSLYQSPSNQDRIWISTDRGGLHRYSRSTGAFEYFFTDPRHELSLIFAMYEDRNRRMWFGSVDKQHIFVADSSLSEIQAIELPPASVSSRVKQFYEAPSMPGTLWIATRGHGLLRFNPDSFEIERQYIPENSTLLSSDIGAVVEVSLYPHILWAVTYGGGLVKLDTYSGSTEIILTQPDGTDCFPATRLVDIKASSDGYLWIGTYDAGLVRYDPQTGWCKVYDQSSGLVHPNVRSIQIDKQDRLWIGTNGGVSMFTPDLEAFTNYGEADGLQGTIFYLLSSYQSPTGEIYLGGEHGFSVIDTERIVINDQPPQIRVTDMFVMDNAYRFRQILEQRNRIGLEWTEREVTFHFVSLDLSRPNRNLYRVRLDPIDQTWQMPTRRGSQQYYGLGAETYVFNVKATNSDGVWSDTVSIPFTVIPPFWKQWWFWSLLSFSGIGLVVAAYQYRIAQINRLEETRQRIADDLHDDIGGKMSSIALKIEFMAQGNHLGGQDKAQLTNISETAREVVDDLRDAIWIVDSQNDDLQGIIERMQQTATQILEAGSYRFTVSDSQPIHFFEMEQRRNLFLMFKEMLHNAVKHAKATFIDISIEVLRKQLTLVVKDNGVGFDSEKIKRGRGLNSLQARATFLQGDLTIDSCPGNGTTVTFTKKIV